MISKNYTNEYGTGDNFVLESLGSSGKTTKKIDLKPQLVEEEEEDQL